MLWWGYIHVDKSIHIKRYFNDGDINDARWSPFVEHVFEEFEASSREEAFKYIKEKVNVH